MKRPFIILLALVSFSWTLYAADHEKAGNAKSGEPRHVLITPDQLQWQEGPPSLPAGLKVAVLEGDPPRRATSRCDFNFPTGTRSPHTRTPPWSG
jgi:hypothetical protein